MPKHIYIHILGGRGVAVNRKTRPNVVIKRYPLRVPPDLLEAVHELEARRTSINTWIVEAIRTEVSKTKYYKDVPRS